LIWLNSRVKSGITQCLTVNATPVICRLSPSPTDHLASPQGIVVHNVGN